MDARTLLGAAVLTLCVAVTPGTAEEPADAEQKADAAAVPHDDRRGFAPMRHDEDWSFLADKPSRREALDSVKYVPFGRASFATLGGEARLQFERYENLDFEDDPELTDSYLLWRMMLHADVRFGDRARGFLQLQSGLVSDQSLPPGPADRDDVAVHEAFVEFGVGRGGRDVRAGAGTLRVGRQELRYGSQRLLAVREGPNIRRSYDVIKWLGSAGAWELDAFVARPVLKRPGVFDDTTEDDRTLSTIYATRSVPRGTLDVYYMGLRHDDACFQSGVADERRHSVGSRYALGSERFDMDAEALLQWGSFGDGDIRAWTAAADLGWRVGSSEESPRLGARVSLISGDGDGEGGDLETFNALFPRGNYFGESALVGPSNLMALHPNIAFRAGEVELEVGWDVYWRHRAQDGLYGPGGNLIVEGEPGAGRYIGHEISITAAYAVGRHFELGAGLSRFEAGTFLERSGRADVNYAMAFGTFKF